MIGPIAQLSGSAATGIRHLLTSTVDDLWHAGGTAVVEIVIAPVAMRRADVAAALSEAREELEALGGRLDVVASRDLHPGGSRRPGRNLLG